MITRGFVFLDRGAHVYARNGYGRLILGKWVHLGVNTALRCHEGTLRWATRASSHATSRSTATSTSRSATAR